MERLKVKLHKHADKHHSWRMPLSRSSSHHSRRSKSPNPEVTETRSTELAGSSTTTLVDSSNPRGEGNGDDTPAERASFREPTVVKDMWAIADSRLRKDPEKREKMEQYDRILSKQLGRELHPVGTAARREQVLHFLDSKLDHLEDPVVETKIQRCSRKASRFFKNSVACFMTLKDVIGQASGSCPPAAAACAGTTALLSICLQAVDQRHILFEGIEQVFSSIRRLAQYEDLIWRKGSERVEDAEHSMIVACSSIYEFQARAACHLQMNPVESSLRNAFKLDGWDALISTMKDAEEKVRIWMHTMGWHQVQHISDNVLELRNEIRAEYSRKDSESRRRRVEDFLKYLIENGCNYEDSKSRNKKRVVGTCDWFTDHDLFKGWNAPADCHGPNLLYVTADPGCGKSVLSRYLVDEILPDDGTAVCYFFFRDDSEYQKYASRALCSLLHQLFRSSPECLTDSMLDTFGALNKKFSGSFADTWKMFVEAAGYKDTICVLDALDECSETGRRQIIDAVTSLCKSRMNEPTLSRSLRFLLTSRPYSYIQSEFALHMNQDMSLIHLQGDSGPSADKISEEIRLVVNSRIEEVTNTFGLEPCERDLIREQLHSIPNRTYLWITLLFDGIFENRVGIDKQYILDMTKKAPKSVDDAYEKILNKSTDKEKAKKLLHIILGARYPLSVTELSLAFAFNGHDQSRQQVLDAIVPESRFRGTMKDLCGLFVVIADDQVYLLHQTAREFLVVYEESPIEADKPESLVGLAKSEYASVDILVYALAAIFADVLRYTCQIVSRVFGLKSYQDSAQAFPVNNFEEAAHGSRSLSRPKHFASLSNHRNHTNDSQHELGRGDDNAEAHAWKGSMMASDMHSTIANISIAALRLAPLDEFETFLAQDYGLMPTYFTRYWIYHYRRSGREHQAKMADSVAALCLPSDSSSHWTKYSSLADKPQEAPYAGPPLCLAAAMGFVAVVERMLCNDDGPFSGVLKDELNLTDKALGRTPLSWAACCGRHEIVRLLLQMRNVDVNSTDHHGETALALATRHNVNAAVKMLINDPRVKVDLANNDRRTPLFDAASNGDDTSVKMLVKAGRANINFMDNRNWTPLTCAVHVEEIATVKLLLGNRKIWLDLIDKTNRTPLSYAAEVGYDEVVKLLLDTGKVRVDRADFRLGRTPLSYAVTCGQVDCGHLDSVKLLLDAGSDIEWRDKLGQTPLFLAIKYASDDMVRLLLERGAETDTEDKRGLTPLAYAVNQGKLRMMELILHVGKADVNYSMIGGHTALSLAEDCGYVGIIRVLRKSGAKNLATKTLSKVSKSASNVQSVRSVLQSFPSRNNTEMNMISPTVEPFIEGFGHLQSVDIPFIEDFAHLPLSSKWLRFIAAGNRRTESPEDPICFHSERFERVQCLTLEKANAWRQSRSTMRKSSPLSTSSVI